MKAYRAFTPFQKKGPADPELKKVSPEVRRAESDALGDQLPGLQYPEALPDDCSS